MTSQQDPEIILYDLASRQGVPWSPFVWRTRLLLNYKRIPYKTVFLEYPDIGPTFKDFGIPPHDGDTPYTVPTIHVPSTGKYLMDSVPISEFLNEKYPDPPLPLTSEQGQEVRVKVMSKLGKVFNTAIVGRVYFNVLRPASQPFFRKSREADFGHTLEELFDDPQKEENVWKSVDEDLRAAGEFVMKTRGDGPFVLGSQATYYDFIFGAILECMRVVHEPSFKRICEYPGFTEIYEACRPFMEKRD